MEFMNVGGGELLIIILFALVLFSPEDILKLMRTLGKHARTARQMWANVTKSLQDDYIPEEVKEVVKETASSVKEARATLSSVRKQLNNMTTSIEENVKDATKLADNEIAEALTTVNNTHEPGQTENSILNVNVETTDHSHNEVITNIMKRPVVVSTEPPVETTEHEVTDVNTSPSEPETALTEKAENENDAKTNVVQENPPTLQSQDLGPSSGDLDTKDMDDAISLTKDNVTKKQELEGAMHANGVYTKLAKVTEDSLKDGGDDS